MPVHHFDQFLHVNNLWDDAHAASLDPVDRLVYRSNLLGSDQRITNTGGGNTSSKITLPDPLTTQSVEVLFVKGSGGDLRTARRENFSSLYQARLLDLQSIYAASPNPGPKTPAEDHMVSLYPHCTFNLNPRPSSIDTPLHAFVPFKHVDHMHPNAVIAIAASQNAEKLTREIFGPTIGYLPWQRPGFELGLALADLCKRNPQLQGAVLGQHGLINWADDDKECYMLTLSLIEKAARFLTEKDPGPKTFGGQIHQPLPQPQRHEMLHHLLPWLRGRISSSNRFIATVQSDPQTLQFVNSADAPRLAELGTSCPDHFLRTKIKPLYVPFNPGKQTVADLKSLLIQSLAHYRTDYQAYYDRNKLPDSPVIRDPNPTVILIPGIGMIAFGKNKSESRVTAEFYNCAIQVMKGAQAVDQYIALPQREAFDIEYWALEEAKLRRMPPDPEFSRRVIVIIGAGSGIGRSTSLQLASEGAHIVAVDLDFDAAQATADRIIASRGQGIGVAGTDISSAGPAIALQADVTSRQSIRDMLTQTLLAYGGIDDLVITAGIYVPPDTAGRISDDQWTLTFKVNTIGPFLLADEIHPLLREQNLPANIVITTSVNAVVPKAGSLAYDASKAAANHLARELAIQLSPLVRVNAVAPATVVAGSSMFPRQRVIASLAKYNIPFAESDDTETLRDKLADFYAQRTLTRLPITPEDQAHAIRFFLSFASAKTTGQVLNVDGGLPEAFLR